MTASASGSPTLPAATLRSPAARRIASSIWTVVVLPLVPVTASQGVSWSGSRSRQASSTSPQTGTPRARAWARSGASGFQPGDVTSRSTWSGRVAVTPAPSRTEAPRTSSSSALAARPSGASALSSRAVTVAPRCRRLSATANPETPKPATTARTPAQESCRPRFAGFIGPDPWRRSSDARDPLGVEDAETGRHTDAADDPEPDRDRHLLPAEHLEVVVDRRDAEEPAPGAGQAPGDLEAADLEQHGHCLHHEQPAQDHQQQLGAGHDRQPRDGPAECERAGVAHEDRRRGGVPPQEAETGAGECGGEHREVERVADVVAEALVGGVEPVGEAGLVVLPDVDQHVGAEDHHRRARRQAVEPVGEVHAVAGRRDDEPDQQHDRDRGQREALVVADERDVLGGRGEAVLVLEPGGQRKGAEGQRDDGLADHLRLAAQAEAALLDDLDVVVEEADRTEADEE